MTQVQPAFWVRYRGTVDPALMPLSTAYNYTLTYQIVGNAPVNLLYGCLGPPQLTKERYIEIRWSPIVGLIRVTIARGATGIFQSNGAECGFRDEGRFTANSGKVTQQ